MRKNADLSHRLAINEMDSAYYANVNHITLIIFKNKRSSYPSCVLCRLFLYFIYLLTWRQYACEAGIFRILFLLALLKCSVAELRTVHKVVLWELNQLCVLVDLTKVDDRLDNVAKRILVIMLMLHPLL